MTKLTKQQLTQLTEILRHATRAYNYVYDDKIAVCRIKDCVTTTLDYQREIDDSVLYKVAKDVGTDLVGLCDTVRLLEQFIEAGLK